VLGDPTVIVDDLHVVYRVRGGKRSGGTRAAAVSRLVTRKNAPGITEVHAVRGVSFEARRGEAVGLIGRNGSGKSTLLRAIAGLLPAEHGAVYSSGQPSLLGVNAVLMNDLSGELNVRLGCLAMGMTPREIELRYQEVVDFSGLRPEFLPLPMNAYSSGMSARLRFSIAAAKSHEVLLIDEALATGDKEFRERSERRINQMRADAGTVFVVSHSLGQVRNTCDRALWLDEGKIVLDGPVEDVIAAYEASS
jgi:teichoic acid transport system ATP-binding protein